MEKISCPVRQRTCQRWGASQEMNCDQNQVLYNPIKKYVARISKYHVQFVLCITEYS